ncbi:hypothetical protein NEOLI_003693 [Neolecta irregularis DAH-3]|uniref:Uncharacterized protein n=1 Tax=Neolecta irregularis (strain DAH-3) TaxID=1198029 RepID=A0A1U7LUL9_NEOID|nr:hypothetical protein NEOLI_003693 [Neolecta irregularis DAH-3]|eukprot:OLL26273.1 hypothetical protein NEOLI_003693 [Neolecta irregularis DAH-3]
MQPVSPSRQAGQFMQHIIISKILEYLVPDDMLRSDFRLGDSIVSLLNLIVTGMLQVLQFGSINRFFHMISQEHPVWEKICLSSMFLNRATYQVNRLYGLKDALVLYPWRLCYTTIIHASPIYSLQDWCTWMSILRCVSRNDNRLGELKLHLKSKALSSENVSPTFPDDQIAIAKNLPLDFLRISLTQLTAGLFKEIFPFICGLTRVPKLYFKDWSSGVFPQCFSAAETFRSTIVSLEFNTYMDEPVDLDLVSYLFPGLVHLTCEFNSGCTGSLKLPNLQSLNLPSISATESNRWLDSFFGEGSAFPNLKTLAIKNHENDLSQDLQVMLETIFESWNLPRLKDLRLVLPKICQTLMLKTISTLLCENRGRIQLLSLGNVYYDLEPYQEFIVRAVSAGLKKIELMIANYTNFNLPQQEYLLKEGLDIEFSLSQYTYLDSFSVSYS